LEAGSSTTAVSLRPGPSSLRPITVGGPRPEPLPDPLPEPAEAPLLLCQRVSKWYGPVLGVNQVSLELRSGITGLVGANGAGKSTLLRLATGQLRPDLGRVSAAGRDAWPWQAKRLAGSCSGADVFSGE